MIRFAKANTQPNRYLDSLRFPDRAHDLRSAYVAQLPKSFFRASRGKLAPGSQELCTRIRRLSLST